MGVDFHDRENFARRDIIKGCLAAATAAAAAAVPAVAVSAEEEQKFDLQAWLDTADLNLVAQYHAARLTEVLGRMDMTRAYDHSMSYEHGYCLVIGRRGTTEVAPIAQEDDEEDVRYCDFA